MCLFELWFSQDICPVMGFLGHMVILFLVFFFKFYYLFILFLAALGLCCCARVFSSCSERGPLLAAVRGLLTAVASPAAEHGL